MAINHPVGLVAVALAILVFFGSIYTVVALNVGWRFGYWVTSAAFGGLMLFISVFWILTGLGPAGEEANWIPVAVDTEEIGSVEIDGTTYETPADYPESPWQTAEESEDVDPGQAEGLGSSFNDCLSGETEGLAEERQAVCEQAQGLLPSDEDLPKAEGTTVAMQQRFEQVKFSVEGGTILGQAVAVPVTLDPRVADDPEVGVRVGEPLRMVGYFDPGSLRVPGLMSFVIFGLWFGFHLWGVHRAEQRKLSPVAG